MSANDPKRTWTSLAACQWPSEFLTLSRPSTCSLGHEFDPLEAGAHVAAAIGSDLSVDASLVSATYRSILKCLGTSPT
jgi:hypothetical protein